MKKLLLLMFLVPVINAYNLDDMKVCTVQAGVKDTNKQVSNCVNGDVLVIKSSGFDEDVKLASKICLIETIKFAGGDSRNGVARTICKYQGYTKLER